MISIEPLRTPQVLLDSQVCAVPMDDWSGPKPRVAIEEIELRRAARSFGLRGFYNELVGWSALERDVSAKFRHGIPLNVAWEYLQRQP
jgi:hypothetical protein